MTRYWFAAALSALAVWFVAPASAAVIVITQSKALAGGVTPGDDEGFPVRLSLPGAYRLDTNLTVPAGTNGIHVTSSHVDIDMNGFRLWGWNAQGTVRLANNGVYSGFGTSSIRNGYISGFRFDGIRLVGVGASSWVVEDMQILGNAGSGIAAFDSDDHRFSGNSILRNTGDGISCRNFYLIEGSVISDNGASGVSIGSGTVLGNTIASNHAVGVYDSVGVADTGVGNNTLIDNEQSQLSLTIDLQPNACIPSPC